MEDRNCNICKNDSVLNGYVLREKAGVCVNMKNVQKDIKSEIINYEHN